MRISGRFRFSGLAVALSVVLIGFALTRVAHAAPLNFTSDTPVVLTSPSTTLTIASGSIADSLTVNATNVVVGLSSPDGGIFTLISPDYGLTVAKTNNDGTAAATCSAGLVDTLVLSQTTGATTYTIVPAAGACTPEATSTPPAPSPIPVGGSVVPPSFTINNGAAVTNSPNVTLSFFTSPDVASFAITTSFGGENVTATSSYASTLSLNLCAGFASYSTGTYLVAVNFLDTNNAFLASSSQSIDYAGAEGASSSTATSSTLSGNASSTIATSSTTVTQLEALLATLETKLQILLKEAAAKGITVPGAVSSSRYIFTRNLTLWDQGKDVNELQRYLVAQNSGPAAQALARHGTTNTFGPLTFAALKEFQKAVSIVPNSGYFGPITRGYIRAHGE